METVTIPLPDSIREFVQAETLSAGYRSPDEYILDLIRDAQRRKAREKVDQLLIEGLESGPPVEWTPELFEKLKAEVRDRHARRARDAR
jgi:antitoxin ParD1/3/4